MGVEEKFGLVKKNTQEIITEEELKSLLARKKRPVAYFGIAPTGPFHIAYLIPLCKIFDFGKAGIRTKILIADIHSALDDLKTPWEEIGKRADYYQKCVELAFPWPEKPEFVRGSSFQISKKFEADLLKLATFTTVKRATRAASEVTRMKEAKVSELIYPIVQALDEEYLGVDIQLGGIDQRHIFAYAREYLPKVGYRPRVEVMTPLIASLKGPGTKMSATDPMSHIKVYDSEELIRKKINNAYCPAGDVKDNCVLQICKYMVFSLKDKFFVSRPEKFGGGVEYTSYAGLEKDFVQKKLHPQDLKRAVAEELIKVFAKVRKYWADNKDKLKELGKNFLV